jgi:hypothetical protein
MRQPVDALSAWVSKSFHVEHFVEQACWRGEPSLTTATAGESTPGHPLGARGFIRVAGQTGSPISVDQYPVLDRSH